MNCEPFLISIIKHLDKLINHLTNYLKNNFYAKVSHTLVQYEGIEK
jgi:hypothetical protein